MSAGSHQGKVKKLFAGVIGQKKQQARRPDLGPLLEEPDLRILQGDMSQHIPGDFVGRPEKVQGIAGRGQGEMRGGS